MIPNRTLEQIAARFAALESRLAEEAGGPRYGALSRDYAALAPVAKLAETCRRLSYEMAEAESMREDPELRALAEEELAGLGARLKEAETALRHALLPADEADLRPAIIEVRAGTGGEEAALFAADLMRMYLRYAESRGWKGSLIDESVSDMGGYREASAMIEGEGAFARLKHESGTHRVQRVPRTESGGRIHTSAATVAVLPDAQDIDVAIAREDIRVDTMRASGAGGQHVNTTDSAVRITHLPTGIVVMASEKSQHQNRVQALRVLRARLYAMKRQEAEAARAVARKGQIGSGDRSERIRTYNFPQARVTDHRIGLTLHRLPQILEGDLDELIAALATSDRAQRLAEASGDEQTGEAQSDREPPA